MCKTGGEDCRDYVTIVHPAYLNRGQERELQRYMDVSVRVYNDLLHKHVHVLETDRPIPTPRMMDKEITQMRDNDALIRSVPVEVLRDAPIRLQHSMERCREMTERDRKAGRDRKVHTPRVKTRSRYRSIPFDADSLKFDGKHITIARGLRIRCGNIHRPKGGVPKVVRVLRKGTGRWYICISYLVNLVIKGDTDLDDTFRAEGYDLGLMDLITDTKGDKMPVPDFHARREREMAKLKRQASCLEVGSRRWVRKQQAIARIEEDVKRKRDGYLDVVVAEMVRDADMVAVERLNVAKMKADRDNPTGRNKMYTEASWGSLLRKVGRKAQKSDVHLEKVNPAYTSRTCSRCGHVLDGLPLSMRTFSCPECGFVADRDRNAALNIMGLGLEALRKRAEPSG